MFGTGTGTIRGIERGSPVDAPTQRPGSSFSPQKNQPPVKSVERSANTFFAEDSKGAAAAKGRM